MNTIVDRHNKELNKQQIDALFFELNKELRKKMRKIPKDFKANLYVVGGACVVAKLQSRYSTNDIDAMWDIGSEMRDCINAVGDRLDLGHTWCNCDFKKTKSYTDAIVTNCKVYKEFDRLIVRMVNLDLLLAMKLVAFRMDRKHDLEDIQNIIKTLVQNGVLVNCEYITETIIKYYGGLNNLSNGAISFIRRL